MSKKHEHNKGLGEYISSIIFSIIFLIIVANAQQWFSFLTSNFVASQYIFYISIMATIIANVIFMVYRPMWFVSMIKVVLNAISLGVVYTLYLTFPFNFNNGGIDNIVRIALIVGIVGTLIAIIVEMVKFVLSLLKPGQVS